MANIRNCTANALRMHGTLQVLCTKGFAKDVVEHKQSRWSGIHVWSREMFPLKQQPQKNAASNAITDDAAARDATINADGRSKPR